MTRHHIIVLFNRMHDLLCDNVSKIQNLIVRALRTPIKMKILFQDQGGGEVQAAGILEYSEDLNLASNTEIGPKDHFDRGSK
jgi:hypothetical protein